MKHGIIIQYHLLGFANCIYQLYGKRNVPQFTIRGKKVLAFLLYIARIYQCAGYVYSNIIKIHLCPVYTNYIYAFLHVYK